MAYTSILIFLLLVSFYLETKYHIRLFSSRRERLLIPLAFFVVGAIWDNLAVYFGHWYFNYSNLLGIKIILLPLEEYLFFLIVPYFVLTLYRVLKAKI